MSSKSTHKIEVKVGKLRRNKDESVTGGKTGTRSNASIENGAAVFAPPFTLDIGPRLVAVRVRVPVLSTAFHKDMSLLSKVSNAAIVTRESRITYLESILAREALVTVRARERLNGQMDTFMALEVVIAVETLGALVAFERSVRRRGWHAMRGWMAPI